MTPLAIVFQLSVALQCDGISTVGGVQSVSRVMVEIDGNEGRISPPAELVPEIAGRGENGWRRLTEMTITEDEVRARFSLNWINKPLVIINRRTGDIEIRAGDVVAGSAGFRGDCRPSPRERLF